MSKFSKFSKIETEEIVSSVEKTVTPPTELITNGDMSSWDGGLPVGYIVYLGEGESMGTITEDNGWAKLSAHDDYDAYLYQIIEEKTPDDVLNWGISLKSAVNDPPFDAGLIILNEIPDNATHYWDGTSWIFYDGGNIINPSNTVSGVITSDDTVLNASGTITVPATGKICMIGAGFGPEAVTYFDNFSLTEGGGLSTEDFGAIKIKEAVEDLVDGDKLMPIYDKNDVLIAYIDPATNAWVFPLAE